VTFTWGFLQIVVLRICAPARNMLGLIFSMTSAFPAPARFGLGALLGL
jgi:hypothetical protein